ncbi:MAG: hypothetical protein K6T63_14010 [Alicyclobacillus herbarius]|uniref:hypothetical protein n=1 Tax=Alicyclobacillus herbarius TaxID=122960 RepID=UPI00235352F2|nr:hypothetical protein [Alicyclobacillus herbarius]MCL6633732.1 hypothetical protein [Alicyclobacillus herbarius]
MRGKRLKMHPTAQKLIWVRGLRSIGQGAMVVDLTLYLRDLHWSGASHWRCHIGRRVDWRHLDFPRRGTQ